MLRGNILRIVKTERFSNDCYCEPTQKGAPYLLPQSIVFGFDRYTRAHDRAEVCQYRCYTIVSNKDIARLKITVSCKYSTSHEPLLRGQYFFEPLLWIHTVRH